MKNPVFMQFTNVQTQNIVAVNLSTIATVEPYVFNSTGGITTGSVIGFVGGGILYVKEPPDGVVERIEALCDPEGDRKERTRPEPMNPEPAAHSNRERRAKSGQPAPTCPVCQRTTHYVGEMIPGLLTWICDCGFAWWTYYDPDDWPWHPRDSREGDR